MIPGAPENKRVEMPESWKLPPEMRGNKALQPVKYQDENGIHDHYALIQKSGFPTGYQCCWCHAKLEFAVKEKWHSINAKRKAFFKQHDECEPAQ